MEKRFTFTDMELSLARKNHGWMGKYYKTIEGSTVKKIYVGIAMMILALPSQQLSLNCLTVAHFCVS